MKDSELVDHSLQALARDSSLNIYKNDVFDATRSQPADFSITLLIRVRNRLGEFALKAKARLG